MSVGVVVILSQVKELLARTSSYIPSSSSLSIGTTRDVRISVGDDPGFHIRHVMHAISCLDISIPRWIVL